MRRLLLVANPAASGFTASLHRDVVTILASGYSVTPVWPDGPSEARLAALAAAEAGYDVAVAMGGDGVVHQVANGLADTDTALGIVPAGTTNVLRRVVDLPARPRAAAEVIAGGAEPSPLPTIRLDVDGPNGMETRLATFAAGVGFDAEVIEESERRPIRKVGAGPLHYARSTMRVVLGGYRRRLPTLRVVVDGRSSDAVGAVAQVHDHFTYLGRASLGLGSPPPVAMTIRRVTVGRLARVVARAARGATPDAVRGVRTHPGFVTMSVDADPPALLEADGELVARTSRTVFTPESGRLRIVAGPGYRPGVTRG